MHVFRSKLYDTLRESPLWSRYRLLAYAVGWLFRAEKGVIPQQKKQMNETSWESSMKQIHDADEL